MNPPEIVDVPTRFHEALALHGSDPLQRKRVSTLQVNVGKICNQACHHCHVDASPRRTESMTRRVADRVLTLLEASADVQVVDITGGAPELCPSFRHLVRESVRLGKQVIDRCNLTILSQPGQEDLPEFLAEHGVAVVASLPCYLEDNVDGQRGTGVYARSIDGLRRLNALGYGRAQSRGGEQSALGLDLVYNPVGPYLPPAQEALEADYKRELAARFGIEFHRLFTITNMPISRFAEQLERKGESAAYMGLLVNHFNASTIDALMCRSLVSVGWDGRLYDCDFNQMLEMPLGGARAPRTVHDIDSLAALEGSVIATDDHCFGCTAGAGSSCGGAIA